MNSEQYGDLQYSDRLLGELLVRHQMISRDQLTIALYEQRQSKRLLGEELLHLAFIDEKSLLSILAMRFNLPILTDTLADVMAPALLLISEEDILQYQIFPVAIDLSSRHLIVAVTTLQDESIFDRLRQYYELSLFLTTQRVIQAAINRYYVRDTLTQLGDELDGGVQPLIEDTSIIIRFVDALLAEAARLQASDLHCEPERAWINLRYRIDGVLLMPKQLHRRHWSALSVRLKLMAGLDIAETRANQDGRILFSFAARQIDCRVSVVPTLYGENIVIRFLDRAAQILTFPGLGFSTKQQQIIKHIFERPYGITLVVGPTGSGKTTTLYSILQHFDRQALNVMTLEDPVEYLLPGIRQISLQALVKMDFASGVRALLRQAPDVILIGEIRDSETAIAAFQAGMTGHRVLASIHAKSAMGAITRLRELGVLNTHIAANVTGLIGQRLVRRLCQHCKTQTEVIVRQPVWQALGCACCNDRGFKGRVVIAEVVYIDTVLETLINTSASEMQLRAYQQQQGISSIAQDAYDKLDSGIIGYSEIQRVLDSQQEGLHAF